MNSFGNILRLTTFGESHGAAIGGVLDGYPAGILIDEDFVAACMARRRPGQSDLTTSRKEEDRVEFLSGIFEGRSTGCPIAFIIRNTQQHSSDYENIKDCFRPSHADYTYQLKYGLRDYRGGGRASARETAVRVAAGALAMLALTPAGIKVQAYTSQVGPIVLNDDYKTLDLDAIDSNPVRCPHEETARAMAALIKEVRAVGDSVGGVVTCVVKGCPAGLGEPLYGKLHAALGAAMLGINAAKGFEYGSGFAGVAMRGSQQNDIFYNDNGQISTRTNRSGGIQGGISNGQDIYFRVAFKPAPTLLMNQPTVDREGREITVKPQGRHDPCVVPRAVPVVEAMTALTLLDFYLWNKAR